MTRAEDRLADQSAAFAQRLTDLLNDTLTEGARVTSALLKDKSGRGYALVAPGVAESAPKPPATTAVPISIEPERRTRERAPLWLALRYQMMLDAEGEWAAVRKSGFGLCINKETMRPAIRIEFDRNMPPGRAAHVQVHGSSAELGFAFGAVGLQLPALEDLHIPVGGHRYRPCLEDFIEFLKAEKLVRTMRPRWKAALDASRREFMDRQLRAAVRRDQHAAADVLRQEGWDVSAPPKR